MQLGQVYRKGKSWLLKYNVKEERDGKIRWVRRVKKLAPVSDKYRTAGSVKHLAAELLAPLNAQRVRPEATQTLRDFIENIYMPFVRRTVRPATQDNYQHLFDILKPHLGEIELRDFDVPAADRLLTAATAKKLAHSTHRNLRNFMSGACRYALRTGALRYGNPVRDTVVPKGKPKAKVTAYSIDEVQAMLGVLGEPARTVVLVAALTGLRHAEIRGLKWQDIKGDELHVRRTVWGKHVGETKTLASAAPVPLLPIVAKALEAHRQTATSEYIFAGERCGRPMVLNNLLRRSILPALAKAKIKWSGWHAYRRGLASNLYALGVAPKVVQAILRHANVSTTLDLYIKTVDPQSQAAMRKLEELFNAGT